MSNISAAILTQLPFWSVFMETNMKTDHAFKQEMPDITRRYGSNSYILTNLANIIMHYISSSSDTWTLQTDRQAGRQAGGQAGSVGPG